MGQSAFSSNKYREIVIDGSVDVEVYNRSGGLVAAIIDDTPQRVTSLITEMDEAGEKIVYLPATDNYSIKLTATGDGLMTYSLYEHSDDKVNKLLIYYDVPITNGQIFDCSAPAFSDEELNKYRSILNTEYQLSTNGAILEQRMELSGEEACDC
ncbi:MAG: hypothetical protein LBT59_05760 [Clostridiales bacterium]|jgi:hypothetical protein|nr:hypothetical protein [Clostridiales bacterium]